MWRRTASLLAISCAAPLLAQYRAVQEIAPGKLLVASDQLGDPNFAESVILIVQHDAENGTMGLILNRRTKIPLSKVFADIKGAKSDPVYIGGPVSTGSAQALFRSADKPEQATRVFGDIYASGSKDLIEKSIAAGIAQSKFRVYIGYGGWEAGQLEREIELGAWSLIRASADTVFDDDPDSLWDRARRESDRRIARARPLPLLTAFSFPAL